MRVNWMSYAPFLTMIVACGGAGYTDAFTVAGDSDSGTDGGPSSASASDGSTAGDARADSTSAMASDAANGTVVADGGTDPVDAGPGGNASSISCGAASCAVPVESCCVYELKSAPQNFSYACVVGDRCPIVANTDSNAMKCTGAANCTLGSVCCVSDANGVTSSSCKASCTAKEAQLCDARAVPTGCGPGAAACSSDNIGDWRLPRSYGTCGGVGN